MPKIHAEKIAPDLFYNDYYSSYLEKDAWQIIKENNRAAFKTFVKLLAGQVGQAVNLNSFARELGVSSTTLASWLNVLESINVIFRLPCYFNNFGKRLVKSPKIYFTEVGFAAYLLGIENAKQVDSHPLLDVLFENMVVMEAVKAYYNLGKEPALYYLKDNHGFEVFILHENSIQLIEIKTARTYDFSLAKNIRKISEKTNEIKSASVIYAGESLMADGIEFRNFKATSL